MGIRIGKNSIVFRTSFLQLLALLEKFTEKRFVPSVPGPPSSSRIFARVSVSSADRPFATPRAMHLPPDNRETTRESRESQPADALAA